MTEATKEKAPGIAVEGQFQTVIQNPGATPEHSYERTTNFNTEPAVTAHANPRVCFTKFDDLSTTVGTVRAGAVWGKVATLLTQPKGEHPTRLAQPLFALANYPDRSAETTDKPAGRPLSYSGGVGDYDGGIVTMAQAVEMVKKAGIAAAVYTTGSHMKPKNGITGPRWRAACPFSEPTDLAGMRKGVNRLNAVLGGILAPESGNEKQSYFYGRVTGVEFDSAIVPGQCIDLADLPEVALKKAPKTGPAVPPLDDSPDSSGSSDTSPQVRLDDDRLPPMPDMPPQVAEFLRDGADEGQRSDLAIQLACELAKVFDNQTVYSLMWNNRHVKDYIAHKRARQVKLQGRYLWDHYVLKARAMKGPHVAALAAFSGDDDWPEPEDLLATDTFPQSYDFGLLPSVYENFIRSQLGFWTDNSPEIYAGLFVPGITTHCPPHVCVESATGSEKFLPMGSLTAIVSDQSGGKTPVMHDVLGSGNGGTLFEWDTHIVNRARIDNAEIQKILDVTNGNHPEGLKKQHPSVLTTSGTDGALMPIIPANLHYGVPTNYVTGEFYDAMCSGTAHLPQGYKAWADFLKTLIDGAPRKRVTVKGGHVTVPVSPFNLVYTTNYGSVSSWNNLEEFMLDGTAARHWFFAAGKPCDRRERVPLDPTATTVWQTLQRRLHSIGRLHLRLAHDDTVETELRHISNTLRRINAIDTGDGNAGMPAWLGKFQRHFSVTCGAMMLASRFGECVKASTAPDSLDLGGEPGALEIPAEIQLRALDYLLQFVAPQQGFFYRRIQGLTPMGERIKAAVARMVRTSATEVTKQELYGSHGIGAMRHAPAREGEALVDALLGAGLVKAMLVPGAKQWYSPTKATRFAVNPGIHRVYAKYLDDIRRKFETVRGDMEARGLRFGVRGSAGNEASGSW